MQESVYEIPLTGGGVVLVDPADFNTYGKNKWQRHSSGYAARVTTVKGVKTFVTLHRLIMNAPKGAQVDHIDGDTFNNRRSNLRICTPSQNMMNRAPTKGTRSAYKGITYVNEKFSRKNRWMASIRSGGIKKTIGYYATEIEAAKAYDSAARIYHGEFARVNFPAH